MLFLRPRKCTSKRACALFASAALLLTVAPAAFAQNTNSGEIRGTVSDPSGAVIPGVAVAILNTQTGVTTNLVTNASGIYDAVSIIPGNYQLTFTGSGFQTLVRSGVDLTVGTITIDAQLTVGATQQQVEVTAEAPLLKTETAEQGTTLESQSMQQLPNVGQDWSNFTKILPGASGSGTGVSVNGNMPYYSNFLADGASTTLPHSANVDVSVFESVSEVQIETSTFSAQYGIGGAVFNQISKSGTNTFHGSAYEYLQNDFFNARDFFSPTVPIERYHNFGGSVSGPVIKNKMFFYYNIDKTINNTVSYPFYTYPTAAMRAGDFSDPAFPTIYDPSTVHQDAQGNLVRNAFPGNKIPDGRIDPVARAVEQYFPTPNLPGFANNWQGGLASTAPFIRQFGRMDYNFSDKNRLTFSITQRDNKGLGQTPDCPIDCNPYDIASYNAQVSDVWTVSANLINEFRFGFTRQGNWFQPETLGKGYPAKVGLQYAKADVFPGISIGGPVGGTSLAPGTNAIYVENSFEPSDVVTMIRGRHILHFGGEVLMYQDNSTPWGNVNSGNFRFSGAFTQPAPFDSSGGLGYADFLLGQVDNWNATNTPITGARQKSPQFFAQDDFKLRPNLTINLGLRYQIQGGWSEVANRIGAFDPTITNPVTGTKGAMWFAGNNHRNNLQANVNNIFLPRVGLAWSPTNKWAIRGGFGIYSYGWSIDTYAANAIGFGTNSTGSLAQTDQVNPVFVLSNPNPPLNYVVASKDPGAYNGQSVNYYPYHTPVARNYQWSFSVQRQLPGNMLAEAAYVGSHTSNLAFPADYNQVPGSLLGVGDAQSNRPFPQFQTINAGLYDAISNYDSLQLQFNKRFSRGVSFDINYTFSKFLDDQDSGGYGGSAGSQPYQDAYNPRLNYGFSNLDRTNMFKGDVVYQLPIGKGKTLLNRGGLLDTLIGGWQVSSTFVFESGAPFTPTVSSSNNSGALSGSWYPNLVGDPRISNPTIDRWFNTDAFAIPAQFTFGNAGRNILRGPRLNDVDLSVGKNFRFPLPRETGNLQVRFDATNAFNHANFSNPDAGLGDSNFGVVSSTVTGTGRILQLGARLSF